MEEQKKEEEASRWTFCGVPCKFLEPTPYLTHLKEYDLNNIRRRPDAAPRSIFGFTPEDQYEVVPFLEGKEEEEIQRQRLGTLSVETIYDTSPSFIPYEFPDPPPSYQQDIEDPNRIKEIDAAKDEANAKSVSQDNLGMPSKKRKEDDLYTVIKAIPGTYIDGSGYKFTATYIRYPSGITEPVVEKVENFNPATDFMVEATLSASGTKEDVGVPPAQMSEEGPLLKRTFAENPNDAAEHAF